MTKLDKTKLIELLAMGIQAKNKEKKVEVRDNLICIYEGEKLVLDIEADAFYEIYILGAVSFEDLLLVACNIVDGAHLDNEGFESIVKRYDNKNVHNEAIPIKKTLLKNVQMILVHKDNEICFNEMVCTEIEDIRIVYYLPAPNDKGFFTIKNDMLDMINVTKDEIHKAAVFNNAKKYPNIYMDNMEYFYTVHTDFKPCGANPLFYPKLLFNIAEKLEDDLIIIPDSTEAFFVFRKGDFNINVLQTLKESTDFNIDKEIKLSDYIFEYKKSNDTLTAIKDNAKTYYLS